MKWLSIVLLALILFGCSAEKKRLKAVEKAKTVAYQNPKYFAEFCQTVYPFKDSIGEPVINYIPADNKNYALAIDSLKSLVNSLKSELDNDSSDCAKVYMKKVSYLNSKIDALQKGYKPCVPDTLGITLPILRKSTSELQSKDNIIADLNTKLASTQAELKESKLSDDKHKKTASTRLFILIAMGIVIGGLVYYIFIRR